MAKRKVRKVKKRWAPRSEGIREARIHCRVPTRIHDALERAAERNGWTVSAEVVHRLEESFALPATPTQAIMTIVGYAIDSMAKMGAGADTKSWLEDPIRHREARAAMQAAFDLLAPQKGVADLMEDAHPPNGRVAFEMLWDEVRRYNQKDPIDTTKPQRAKHQRRLSWLREALGTLPDRIVLWGKTGKEARQEARRRERGLSIAEIEEFRRLARERIEVGLSPEKLGRLQALFDATPQQQKRKLDLWDLSNPGPFGKIIPTDEESES